MRYAVRPRHRSLAVPRLAQAVGGSPLWMDAAVTDQDLLALCVWDEARGEPDAGKQAVAQVVLNRALHKFHSDGTIPGTVLAKDQFSGFWFDMVGGKYQRVCWDLPHAEARAENLLRQAQWNQHVWADCEDAVAAVLQGKAALPLKGVAVLYLNPAVLPRLPEWATPSKAVATIGHHTFYSA